MEIQGFKLSNCDHASKVRPSGISIYYKVCLPLKVLDSYYLQESINFKLKIGDNIPSLWPYIDHLTNHSINFESFSHNLELSLEKLVALAKIYNQFYNTLRLFDVLLNFPFITSETMGDYYLQTCYIRVASQVPKPLKT